MMVVAMVVVKTLLLLYQVHGPYIRAVIAPVLISRPALTVEINAKEGCIKDNAPMDYVRSNRDVRVHVSNVPETDFGNMVKRI